MALQEEYFFAASVEELSPGKTLCVELQGQEILLCHTSEGFFAVDILCSHAAERLDGGRLKGCKIFCPLHGAAFDVRDGAALSRPASAPVASYPVKLVGDQIWVCLGAPG